MEYSNDSLGLAPTYWLQGCDGLPCLNPAVVLELDLVDTLCKEKGFFGRFLEMIRQMLTVFPKSRLTAAQLCEQFQGMLVETQSYLDGLRGTFSEAFV
jgi:hypothetical protein